MGYGPMVAPPRGALSEVAPTLRISDPHWRERDVGAWTGMTRGEIHTRWPDSESRRRLLGSAEIGGESEAAEATKASQISQH